MPVITTAFATAPGSTIVLLLLTLFGLGVAVDRSFVVARSRLSGHGRPFIERMVALVQGGEIDAALEACSSTRAILPDIGLIVLRTRMREEADLRAVAEAAVRSTTPKLVRRLRYIPAAATAAALVGAAGSAAAASQLQGAYPPELFAPLALGLFIAAGLVLLHTLLANQVDTILAQVSEFSHRLVNALLDRPDVRLGHR